MPVLDTFPFLSGGQAETGGAHAEREAHPAGHHLPLPCQSGVPLQGEETPSAAVTRFRAKKKKKQANRATMATMRRTSPTCTWSWTLCPEGRCSPTSGGSGDSSRPATAAERFLGRQVSQSLGLSGSSPTY